MSTQLLTIKQASQWASGYLNKNISDSNISYLIQYGRVPKHDDGASTLVDPDDLITYYQSYFGKRELNWKSRLGHDLNWSLSFDNLREKDTTKHVHRLHPYKGKFIPQLVEYFIDDHTDGFKKQAYFKKGDIILDPFSGSGTTLVQANELGLHSIGVDVSIFNSLITQSKLSDYDFASLQSDVSWLQHIVDSYESDTRVVCFEKELLEKLNVFNQSFFPSPDYKRQVKMGQVNEEEYASTKASEFLQIYQELVRKYQIELNKFGPGNFLDKWYIRNVRNEIDFVFGKIKNINNKQNRMILNTILSRTIRSCRATTHSDLATLKEPQVTTYYCWKHKKICKPLFSIKTWLERYATDTLFRLGQFAEVKTDAEWLAITADSRTVDIEKELKTSNHSFYSLYKKKKIKGVFTSPPYVGQIDYHEQHAYAYDLLGLERHDDLEIGPLFKGKGLEARKSYVEGISRVLINSAKFLAPDYHIFIVANDKFSLYPEIAKKSGMKIINQYKRPVLNRTERDKSPYSESIFHLVGEQTHAN